MFYLYYLFIILIVNEVNQVGPDSADISQEISLISSSNGKYNYLISLLELILIF